MNNQLPIIDEPQRKRSCELEANCDPTAEQKEYVKRKTDSFQLASDGIWATYQGEGVTIGQPCVFMRLLECNLECSFCDAPNAIRTDRREYYEGSNKAIDQVASEIQQCWTSKKDHPDFQGKPRLVITGGEPLLQQQKIKRLLVLLPNWDIEIETNGTILPAKEILKRCQINCSPKLGNSGMLDRKRIQLKVIEAINAAHNSMFKIVCTGADDVEEWRRDFEAHVKINPSKVLLMPEGTIQEELTARRPALEALAAQYNYSVTDRLQCKSQTEIFQITNLSSAREN